MKGTDVNSWSGLWSEPQNGKSRGRKLMQGDTVYLLGVEGEVRQELGAWGWTTSDCVPWDDLKKKLPDGKKPAFCFCDNFISFYELIWNFGLWGEYDWNVVPFITYKE